MANELVSVIIPSYNRASTIERAVVSILSQTWKDLEVIVVDDGSQDNTEEVMKEIMTKDPRIRYYRMEQNGGACAARNKGVELAKGSIIAFQDSDDMWKDDKLERQIEFMKKGNYEFVSCAFRRIKGNKEEICGTAECPADRTDLWCQLLNNNWVSTQTIVCYRYCFADIRFDPKVKRFQDWDLALQAALYFRMGSLNEPLVDVYLQENSISNTVKERDAKIFLIRKHGDYVDFKNRKMAGTYYRRLADVTRKTAPRESAKAYLKSFRFQPSMRTAACWFLTVTGLMRFRTSRT